MERIKIATHQCIFNQNKWLLKNIENAYPFVDKIYLSYSKLPWNYNNNARDIYVNDTDLKIIENSKFFDKIEIINGDWLDETSQRNSCVEKAMNDGFDYLIIQDTDEFYLDSDYSKMIEFIQNNQEHDVYKCAWLSFWKTTEWVVVNEQMEQIIGYPQIAINLKRNIIFRDRRNPNSDNGIIIPDITCYHLSFVLDDNECLTKLKTWGHSHEFDVDLWYEKNWVNWTPDIMNFHPINPPAWHKVVKHNNKLPKELIN
jgi:hypothetical protein